MTAERPYQIYLAIILIGAFIMGGGIKWLLSLEAEDTIYDYQTSSLEKKVDWFLDMCNGGECIDSVDWACGFEFDLHSHFDEMGECFDGIVNKAKPWTTLDQVRKACGKKYAEFSGSLFGDKLRCKEKGGIWGQLSSPPRIEY